MGAHCGGLLLTRFASLTIPDARVLDRSAGLQVDAARPGVRREAVGRNQLAGLAVEDVKEPILVGLHQNLAFGSVDREVGKDQILNGVEVPLVAGCTLVVPDVGAGISIDRYDRRCEQIVALVLAAPLLVPYGSVTRPEIDQVEFGIVGTGDPRRAAAPIFP